MGEQKLIANRYQMGDLIGQGGMGAVYRGTDTRNGRMVAIKALLQEVIATKGEEVIERFRREVEALRRLDHPNIIKLLGTAKDGGYYYIIMEYADGGSLSDVLRAEPQLPIERILEIALDLSDALTRAHHLDIIHRDLKPANVLLTRDGTLRLTDFGVARIGDRTRLTKSGYVVGTGAYLSPEACRGYDLDWRTDIWAFGVLIYEMLTGRLPFSNDAPAALITAILMQPAPDVRQFRPDVPPALASLVQRMLEKDRERRPFSARQVGAQIEMIQFGADIPVLADSAPTDWSAPLLRMVARWEQRAQEAADSAEEARQNDASQTEVHGAVANTYTAAAKDIREFLLTGEVQTAATDPGHMFVPVKRQQVEQLMQRAGLTINNLYEGADHIFSAIFPKMPPFSAEQRMSQITAVCNTIIVVESGRLPDTLEPYIDFGFTAPPDL